MLWGDAVEANAGRISNGVDDTLVEASATVSRARARQCHEGFLQIWWGNSVRLVRCTRKRSTSGCRSGALRAYRADLPCQVRALQPAARACQSAATCFAP